MTIEDISEAIKSSDFQFSASNMPYTLAQGLCDVFQFQKDLGVAQPCSLNDLPEIVDKLQELRTGSDPRLTTFFNACTTMGFAAAGLKGYLSQPNPDVDPRVIALLVRMQLQMEESCEMISDMVMGHDVQIFDAICDALFVLLGHVVTLRKNDSPNLPPLEEMFREIVRSNRTKRAALPGESGRLADKGSGYSPPNLVPMLRAYTSSTVDMSKM